MNIPDCPNCDLKPVDFNDKVGMWVIVCECCGLMTSQHTSLGSACTHWRYLVKQIKQSRKAQASL